MVGKTTSSIDAKAAVRALAKADPILGRAMRRHGAFALTVNRGGTPFELLAHAVVRQQLSNKAAATIEARLIAALGGTCTPEIVARAEPDLLRGAGLSRAKAATLRDLAAKTLDGTIPGFRALNRMEDDAIIEHLTQVKGVGVWTAQMFLMFSLARPDIMPVTDYGVRKGFQRVYDHAALPAPKAVLDYAEIWRPWRSVASWYLWRAADAD
ncbi:MAG TPA: DNA-3-methyladenine glycosylase [Stellaceae bacterium]|nr:DNA-3-methyladenine glycosylase [Stellaceae bacterium]